MVKCCCHGLCMNSAFNMRAVTFFPFPKPITEPDKCWRWVEACNRENFTVASVNRNTYICNQHFRGGKGPTAEYPDPIVATIEQYPEINNRSRKKLKPSAGLLQNTSTAGLLQELQDPSNARLLQDASTAGSLQEQDPSTAKTSNEYNNSETLCVNKVGPAQNVDTITTLSVQQCPTLKSEWIIEVVTENSHASSPTKIPPESNPVACPNTESILQKALQGSSADSNSNPATKPAAEYRLQVADKATPSANVVLPFYVPISHLQPPNVVYTVTEERGLNCVRFPTLPFSENSRTHHNPPPSPLSFYNQLLSLHPPPGWAFYYAQEKLIFILVQDEVVTKSVKLCNQLDFLIKICGEELMRSHPVYASLSPEKISNVQQLLQILAVLNDWTSCLGVTKEACLEHYMKTISVKDCKLTYQNMSLRSHGCHLLLQERNQLCVQCQSLKRRLLSSMRRKRKLRKPENNARCNIRYLPMKEIQRLMRIKKRMLQSSALKIKRLKKKLMELRENVSDDDDQNLTDDDQNQTDDDQMMTDDDHHIQIDVEENNSEPEYHTENLNEQIC